jgi:A/G-specific adenine glycosylase
MTEKLLQWYDSSARNLPWRASTDPYSIWLSEIMLQQTRVDTVIEYYKNWLKIFPTIQDLANASEEQILRQWQGLGYYSRARNFHKAAKLIVEREQGQFPETAELWRTLPGVGEYTAAAIASIAYNQAIPVFDGNVIRVMTRIMGIKEDPTKKVVKDRLLQQSMKWISTVRPGDYNQAMMELGATICLPNGKPLCTSCPISQCCRISKSVEWRDIPLKKATVRKKVEQRTVFILRNQEKILIQKRAETGLLANLWEFPNVEGHFEQNDVLSWLLNRNYNPKAVEAIEKKFKHVFSHIEWHMRLWIIDVENVVSEEKVLWISIKELQVQYALPVAFSVLLDFMLKKTNKRIKN